mgnify:CR=1 FL=1
MGRHGNWQKAFRLAGLSLSAIALGAHPVLAQVVPDNTLGAESSSLKPNGVVLTLPATLVEGGARRGANLFHSFQQFSLGPGDRLYFANPGGVLNIISRVTGANPSTIDGTLGVDGLANLYLLNPRGVVIGANARLDLAGALVVSTASALQFGSQGSFSAIDPAAPPLLTVNPSALLFNQFPIAPIHLQNAEFNLLTGGGLLVGGDITFDSSKIYSAGTNIELAAIAAPATVGLREQSGRFTLEIEPNQSRGDILLQNRSIISNTNYDGNGQTHSQIALWGRNVTLQGGSYLDVSGYAGTDAGRVAIDARETVLLTGAIPALSFTDFSRSGIYGTSDGIWWQQGRGGDVTIKARQLSLQDAARIDVRGVAGDGSLTVHTSESMQLVGNPFRNTYVQIFSGDTRVNTGQLLLRGRTQINAEKLTVDAREAVQLIGTPYVEYPALNVLLQNLTDARLSTDRGAESNSRAGDITINTPQLLLQDKAYILAGGGITGIGGSIRINASDVTLTNTPANRVLAAPATISTATLGGQSGDITISTRRLLVQNGSGIASGLGSMLVGGSEDSGQGGNMTIAASESVTVAGNLTAFTRTGRPSAVFSSALTTATTVAGNAGNLAIATARLQVLEGGQVLTDTRAAGAAGTLAITATETVTVAGVGVDGSSSTLSTRTTGSGQGGTIALTTGQLQVQNRGLISTQTSNSGNAGNLTISATRLDLQSGGQILTETAASGDAGNLTISVRDAINLTGTADQGGPSLLSARTLGSGRGGDLTLRSDRVQLYDRALISTETLDSGSAGTLSIAARRVDLTGGSQIRTTTAGVQNAGNLQLAVADRLTIVGTDSGLFANTQPGSRGSGGDIAIVAGVIDILNQGRIAVDSQGVGTGGNLRIQANRLLLDDRGQLSAETGSSQGGNIFLQLRDFLLLRHNSRISTTAGTAAAGGDGGNISITVPILVGLPRENSDITANAFNGRGGQVTITAAGVFGMVFRSRADLERLLGSGALDPGLLPTNDITAISQASADLSGAVNLNLPDTNPSQGAIDLSQTLVDASQLVSQSFCRSAGGSEFIVTGRGGLPDPATEVLSGETTWEDWRLPRSTEEPRGSSPPRSLESNKNDPVAVTPRRNLVQAQGWFQTRGGKVVLTAEPLDPVQQIDLVAMNCGQFQ